MSGMEEAMDWNILMKQSARDRLSGVDNPDPDIRKWLWGGCGDYALALQEMYPHMKMGMHIDSYPKPLNPFSTPPDEWAQAMDEDDQGWTPNHVFAHDDTHAYDARGAHPLPYEEPGLITQLNLSRQDVEDQGWPEEDLSEAKAHIQANGIGR